MKLAPEASSFSPLWWLTHGLIISAMAVAGIYLGHWLVAVLMQPVVETDPMSLWWQMFRKLAATLTGSIFVGLVIGYVLLILPDQG